VLNLLLSGDNALVIALAARALPRRTRMLGQVWGAVGAVLLRLVIVGVVSALLRIPLVPLVGGMLLVWIAVRLVRPETAGASDVRRGGSLMNRYTWIVWLGGGLLGYVAGEMLVEDPVVLGWAGERAAWPHFAIPVALGITVTMAGWWLGRGRRHAHVPEQL
jgi:predicted tellurium resistance membrane protein TerC